MSTLHSISILLKRFVRVSFVAMLANLSACAIFLPRHSNSAFDKDDSIEISLLTKKQLAERGLEADYDSVFGTPKTEAVKEFALPAIGGAVPIVAGFAIDYVQGQLKDEAARYEAQFSKTIAADLFYKPTKDPDVVQVNYLAIEILRRSKTTGEIYYRSAFAIGPSKDGRMMRIAPIYFQTRRAKVKVLSDEKRWLLAPTAWIGKTLRTGGHEISSGVNLAIDGYWIDKDQALRVTKCAAFEFNLESYDINSTAVLRASDGSLDVANGGWFIGVPPSLDAKGNAVGLGTFTVKAVVTEKDKSNAKKYLESAEKILADKKSDIIKTITSGITNNQDGDSNKAGGSK